VLVGERGSYTCSDEAAKVDVPATLQAVIAARIDRLETSAKLHTQCGGGHRDAVR
jgi:hypothetical protein